LWGGGGGAPPRILYLFDTFSGFSAKDTSVENEHGFSDAREHEFNNTDVSFVLSKMKYPDKCTIRQGYFPDTAAGLDDEVYAFVSMDADLYNPTLEGLRYFYPRLVEGGMIFLHDYFTEDFWGVKSAVDTYLKEQKIKFSPIGDGCTILIHK
jgi:O-methyltransferase